MGKCNGRYKRGLFTQEVIEMRRAVSKLVRAGRDTLDALED